MADGDFVTGITWDQWWFHPGDTGEHDGPYPTEEHALAAMDHHYDRRVEWTDDRAHATDGGVLVDWELVWVAPGEYWAEGYVDGTARRVGPVHMLRRVCGPTMAAPGERAFELETPMYRYVLEGPPAPRSSDSPWPSK